MSVAERIKRVDLIRQLARVVGEPELERIIERFKIEQLIEASESPGQCPDCGTPVNSIHRAGCARAGATS